MKKRIEVGAGAFSEKIPEPIKKELCELAIAAREKSYCPYSHIAVGAALLCADGSVYTGANIENAAYSPSIFSAVHDGKRDFLAIAIAGGEKEKGPSGVFPPCGVCRQVMAEFFGEGALVLLADGEGYEERTLAALLPDGFGPLFLS